MPLMDQIKKQSQINIAKCNSNIACECHQADKGGGYYMSWICESVSSPPEILNIQSPYTLSLCKDMSTYSFCQLTNCLTRNS